MELLKEEDEEEEDAAAKRSEADRRTDKDELTSLICFAMAYSKLLIHLLSFAVLRLGRASARPTVAGAKQQPCAYLYMKIR